MSNLSTAVHETRQQVKNLRNYHGCLRYPMLAYTGYGGAGKTVAAQLLIAHGYHHQCFGHYVKREAQHVSPGDVEAMLAWCEGQDGMTQDTLAAILAGWQAIHWGRVSVDTQDRTGPKELIRPFLEWLGEWQYDSILYQFFSELKVPCVNDRLMRVREAEVWKECGGTIIEIVNPKVAPETKFAEDAMEELWASGLIDHVIRVLDAPYEAMRDDLHQKVRELCQI